MNSNMMMLLLLTMGNSSSSGSSSSGVMEAFLYSSNMLPEMMRTLLAVTSAKKNADALAQKDKDAEALAQRLAIQVHDALKVTFGTTGTKIPKAEVESREDLKALLSKLTTTQYAAIVAS